MASPLQLPREGIETIILKILSANKHNKSPLQLPREGIETPVVGTLSPARLWSPLQLPREGIETFLLVSLNFC